MKRGEITALFLNQEGKHALSNGSRLKFLGLVVIDVKLDGIAQRRATTLCPQDFFKFAVGFEVVVYRE